MSDPLVTPESSGGAAGQDDGPLDRWEAGSVPEPAAWTVDDLREQVLHLGQHLEEVSGRAAGQVAQVEAWAAGLPTRHRPVPDPVRVADLASTDLQTPLSLARRVVELGRLLTRIDELSQTFMPAIAVEAPLFASDLPLSAGSDNDAERADSSSGPDPALSQLPPLVDVDEGAAVARISLTGHCQSAWNDGDGFERQRQAIRRVMTFDGNRTWHGTLAASINDDLAGWQHALAAAGAGASIEIHLP